MALPDRIFVFEFITGGGVATEPLPVSLLGEGEAMLGALLHELGSLPELQLLTLRDARLPAIAAPVQCLRVASAVEYEQAWSRALAWADAVWPIAPETDGVLLDVTERIIHSGCVLLGSQPGAVKIASSKLKTCHALTQAGVPVAHTLPLGQVLPVAQQGWVIKPDDGAGSEEIHYLSQADTLASAVLPVGYEWVVQAYIEGISLSLSVLCDKHTARVLSCNEQHIERTGGRMHLVDVTVHRGGCPDDFRDLAAGVCAAIPGLQGYIGIDIQMTPTGPVVIEVNPRLTTAYAGLCGHSGHNVAELILAGGGWES